MGIHPETDLEIIEAIWRRSWDHFDSILVQLDVVLAGCDKYLEGLLPSGNGRLAG